MASKKYQWNDRRLSDPDWFENFDDTRAEHRPPSKMRDRQETGKKKERRTRHYQEW